MTECMNGFGKTQKCEKKKKKQNRLNEKKFKNENN